VILCLIFFYFYFRLYGFKIHPLAYQIQQQAAANFKAPARPRFLKSKFEIYPPDLPYT